MNNELYICSALTHMIIQRYINDILQLLLLDFVIIIIKNGLLTTKSYGCYGHHEKLTKIK